MDKDQCRHAATISQPRGCTSRAAHRLIKDPTLADNPAEVAAMRTALEPGAERLGHIDQPGVHAVLRELRAVVAEYGPDKLLIGVADPGRWAAYYGVGDELDLPLNFAFWSAPFSADGFRDAIAATKHVLRGGACPLLAFRRAHAGRAVLVALNFAAASRSADL